MDEYDLPKRIKRTRSIESLDGIMASESNDEINEMTAAEQLFYSGISREEEGDEE